MDEGAVTSGPRVEGAPPDPRHLGRYTLHQRLARGGMASVFLAEHRTADGFRKWLAIKTIHAHLADDPAFVAMFLDEARLAARFDHPNVCTVFDFGRVGDTCFLAMEHLQGLSLANVIRRGLARGGLPIGVTLTIIADAARGLHAAHELRAADGSLVQVVHRDVSPQNLFVLFSGHTKVVDFGVARFADRIQRTVVGELRGKPGYLSPEQWEGGPIDRRADLFSLGVVLWECIAGERLFLGDSEVPTSVRALTMPIVPPSTRRTDCPPALDAIVLRALARDPAARFETADALARALEDVARQWQGATGTRATAEWMAEACAEDRATLDDRLREATAQPLSEPPAPSRSSLPSAACMVSETSEHATRRSWGPRVGLAIVALGVVLAVAMGAARARHPKMPIPASHPTVNALEAATVPTSASAALPTVPVPRAAPAIPVADVATASPVPPSVAPTRPTRASRPADGPRRAPLQPLRGYPGGSR